MKAIVLTKPERYPEYIDFEIDNKDTGKSKVKILAAALNHRDLWIAKGQYAGIQYPTILGSDGMGLFNGRRVIINPSQNWGNNENVQSKEFKILGLPDHGTFSEYVYTEEKYIHDVPKHLSDIEAAALPLAGLTAFRAMFTRGKAKRDEKILITGIGGGVALFALQYAIAIGMKAYVSSSSDEKIQKAISLGAKGGINYNDNEFIAKLKEMTNGVDIIIDSAAGNGFADYLKVINPAGRIVIYGGTRGKINNLIPQIIFWKQVSVLGSTMGSDKDFADMLSFVEKFKIKPVIDSIYPMENYLDAFKRMETGKQSGKVVLVNPDI